MAGVAWISVLLDLLSRLRFSPVQILFRVSNTVVNPRDNEIGPLARNNIIEMGSSEILLEEP